MRRGMAISLEQELRIDIASYAYSLKQAEDSLRAELRNRRHAYIDDEYDLADLQSWFEETQSLCSRRLEEVKYIRDKIEYLENCLERGYRVLETPIQTQPVSRKLPTTGIV